MSVTIAGTKRALGPNLSASFLASGGTTPYTYSVLSGGAGGSIDPVTGLYAAPAVASDDPKRVYDTVQVSDFFGLTDTWQILVGDPLLLMCEIIENQLGLTNGRVFLWDQKLFQPTDAGLYVAVTVSSLKPFSNNTRIGPTGWQFSEQVTNVMATVDLDIMSRGPTARTRKEEVIMALNSIYSQSQQEMNSFYVGKLAAGARFINLSQIDGAAIPYRYRISVNMQYAVTKQVPVQYFDTFATTSVITNP